MKTFLRTGHPLGTSAPVPTGDPGVPGNSIREPSFVVEVGNLSVMTMQHWVLNSFAKELFKDNLFRRGFLITNNGQWTVYIGTTNDYALLQKVGTPIYAKTSFSSALYQGRLFAVADAVATGSCDVRVWEENM